MFLVTARRGAGPKGTSPLGLGARGPLKVRYKEHGKMSYTRNLAGAVALLASSSLLGLGCAVATDDKSDDAADQSAVADDATKTDEQGLTQSDDSAATSETTGESKDALWGGGFGRFGGFGRGIGWGGGFGRFGGFGRGIGWGGGLGWGRFGGFGRGIGWGGWGGWGGGFPGYGFGGYGLGFPVYGYPVYGLGGCGFGC
jgi:hypothetical protein